VKKWKVGIIGAGGIARGAHMPGWKNLKNTEVIAVADSRKEACEFFKKEFGVKHTFGDYNKMLEMEELDILDVCTPNRIQCPAAVASLNAGKNVLCEKPLAVTPEEVQQMIDASRKAKKKLMTAQHQRFAPESQIVKKMCENGDMGDIYYARAQALRRRGIPAADTFIKKELSGGGPMIDIGVHILDLTYWLMGCPKVESVTGTAVKKLASRYDIHNSWGEWDRKAYNVEDFAAGFVKFTNGASLTLETSFLLHMKEPDIYETNIFGTKAGLRVGCGTPEIYSEENRACSVKRLTDLYQANAHQEEIRFFVEALDKGLPSPVPPEQSLEVIKMLDGIYRSQEAGKAIYFK